MVLDDVIIGIVVLAHGAFPAILEFGPMLQRVSAVIVAAKLALERHGAETAAVGVQVYLLFFRQLLVLLANDYVWRRGAATRFQGAI